VIDEGISQWFASHDFVEIEHVLGQSDVPYTKIFNIKDVLADPQAQHRQSVMRIADADLGSIPAPCVVPRISGASEMTHRSGPAVGEHNADFFGELGLSPSDLERLKAKGVI
jgi:crotonobetainyl-CoA:carnitine CoA-transferase CaiB-like acyl-CoA transferase